MIVSTFCCLQVRHERVHRLRLCGEVHRRDSGRDDDRRGLQRRHADDGDLHAVEMLDRVGREDRLARVLVRHVRGEEVERRAAERIAVLAPVDGVAAAVLHPQQLVDALVELVVPDTVVVELHQVERLDRRLVVEQRRDQRRRADQVTGRDEQRVRVRRPQLTDVAWRGTRTPPNSGVPDGPRRPAEPAGGCSAPWKSFRPRIWISVVCAFSAARGDGSPFAPAAGTTAIATASAATRQKCLSHPHSPHFSPLVCHRTSLRQPCRSSCASSTSASAAVGVMNLGVLSRTWSMKASSWASPTFGTRSRCCWSCVHVLLPVIAPFSQ